MTCAASSTYPPSSISGTTWSFRQPCGRRGQRGWRVVWDLSSRDDVAASASSTHSREVLRRRARSLLLAVPHSSPEATSIVAPATSTTLVRAEPSSTLLFRPGLPRDLKTRPYAPYRRNRLASAAVRVA